MILTTGDAVPGQTTDRILGLVRGNTVRVRHVGRDIAAALRNLVGGEVSEYTKLMAESRDQAIDRMVQQAAELGADAIVAIRFTTSMIMTNASEILVYGTAVKLDGRPVKLDTTAAKLED